MLAVVCVCVNVRLDGRCSLFSPRFARTRGKCGFVWTHRLPLESFVRCFCDTGCVCVLALAVRSGLAVGES